MKSLIFAASAVAALGLALPAAAQIASSEPEHLGGYGELGYAHTTVHNADQSVIQARGGWRFNRFLGVEGELGVGVDGDNRTFAAGTPDALTVGTKQKFNEAAYAVGYLPLTPRADLFARVGYGFAQYKLSPEGMNDYNVHTNGLRYGLGAQYFLDGRNGLRFDYTRYDINNVSDNLGYFGGDKTTGEWALSYSHRF